jgi:hypothetical protein
MLADHNLKGICRYSPALTLTDTMSVPLAVTECLKGELQRHLAEAQRTVGRGI